MSITIVGIRNMSVEEIARTAQHLIDTGDYGPIVKEVLTQFIEQGAPDIKEELANCKAENARLHRKIKEIRGLTQEQ